MLWFSCPNLESFPFLASERLAVKVTFIILCLRVEVKRKLFLAAYDVGDPKRLRAALRIIKSFASGGQKSVYECWLTPSERTGLAAAMSAVLNFSEDSFVIIPLEPRRPQAVLGIAAKPADPALFYLE